MNQSSNFKHFNRFEVEHEKETFIDSETNNTRVCQRVLVFMPVFFGLLVIALFASQIGILRQTNVDKRSSATRIMSNLDSMLAKNPWSSISMVTKASTCPVGTLTQTIGTFYGVNAGCVCSDGRSYDGATCTLDSTCQFVNDFGKNAELVWQGYKFCVTEITGWTTTLNNNDICPSGYKPCPYQVCIQGANDATNKCPITKIALSWASVGGAPNAFVFQDDTTTVANANVFRTDYTIAHGQEGIPYNVVIGIEAVQSTTSNRCMDYTAYAPLRDSKLNYPRNKRPELGCQYFGQEVKNVPMDVNKANSAQAAYPVSPDTINDYGLTTYQTDNDETITIFKNLNQYTTLYTQNVMDYKDQVRLFTVHKPSFSKTAGCDQAKNFSFGNYAQTGSNFASYIYGFGICCIVLCVIIVLLGFFIIIRRNGSVGFFAGNSALAIVTIFGLITSILIIAYGITIFILYSDEQVSSTSKIFNNLVDNECLTDNYPAVAKYIKDFIFSIWVYQYYICKALFTLAVIYFVLTIFAIAVRAKNNVAVFLSH